MPDLPNPIDFAVPAFVLLVLNREFTWALVVFVVAGLTDALDGWVARHANRFHTCKLLAPKALAYPRQRVIVRSSCAAVACEGLSMAKCRAGPAPGRSRVR